MVQFVNSFLEAIDVNSSDYEEVRENIAGVVSGINPDTFRGISLSVDMVNETFLSAGKVTDMYYKIFVLMFYHASTWNSKNCHMHRQKY